MIIDVKICMNKTNEQEKKGIDYSNSHFSNNWNYFRRSNRYILLHESHNAARNW